MRLHRKNPVQDAEETVFERGRFLGIDGVDILFEEIQDFAYPFQFSQVVVFTGQHCTEQHVALT
jgi:hypothetical protein